VEIRDLLNELAQAEVTARPLTSAEFFSGFLAGTQPALRDHDLLMRSTLATNFSLIDRHQTRIILDRRWFEQIYTLGHLVTAYNSHKDATWRDAARTLSFGLFLTLRIEQLSNGDDRAVRKASLLAHEFTEPIAWFRVFQQKLLAAPPQGKFVWHCRLLPLYAYFHEFGHMQDGGGTEEFSRIHAHQRIIWNDFSERLRARVLEVAGIEYRGRVADIAHLVFPGPFYDEETSAANAVIMGLQEENSAREVFADMYMGLKISEALIGDVRREYRYWDDRQCDVFVCSLISSYVEYNNVLTGIKVSAGAFADEDVPEGAIFDFLWRMQGEWTARLAVMISFLGNFALERRVESGEFSPYVWTQCRDYDLRAHIDDTNRFTLERQGVLRELMEHCRAKVMTLAAPRDVVPLERAKVREALLARTGFNAT
jgi:hypothetical protein